MESLLRGALADAARHIGLALPDPAYNRAVETGLFALADGHDFDYALEVARSVLPQPAAAAARRCMSR